MIIITTIIIIIHIYLFSDRLNVNHFSKKSKSGDQVLLYMDQNSLVYDEVSSLLLSPPLSSFFNLIFLFFIQINFEKSFMGMNTWIIYQI